MFKEWFNQYLFVYAMGGLCALGLLIKVILNFVYRRLMKASNNMSTSKNKLARLMKLKFETFYKLKIGVNNVDIFVDKYVYKHRFCGVLLSTWENFSGLFLVLCLLAGPVCAVGGIALRCEQQAILYTFLSGIVASALLIFVDNLLNINNKKQIVKVNMKDYLENFLKVRLEQEVLNPELVEQYRIEYFNKVSVDLKKQRKEEKRLEKERREREKLLELERKEEERRTKKQQLREEREAFLAKKEEDKLRAEEERRQAAIKRAEAKRRQIEEKKFEDYKRVEEEKKAEELRKQEAEKKSEEKRILAALRLEEEEKHLMEIRKEEEQRRQIAREKALQSIQSSSLAEVAVAQEDKNKKQTKKDRIRERNEHLKEEIKAQREQRYRERDQGKDPFDVYTSQKSKDPVPSNRVNNFNMEYEMRVKAAQREEKLRKEQEEQRKNTEVNQKKENDTTVKSQIKGNSPYEDTVIDDILKEFLA